MQLVVITTCADTLGLKFCWHEKLGFMSWQTTDKTMQISFQTIWSEGIVHRFQFCLLQVSYVFNLVHGSCSIWRPPYTSCGCALECRGTLVWETRSTCMRYRVWFPFFFKPWLRSLASKCSSRHLVNRQKTMNVHNTNPSLFYWMQ